jgi:hypothetical protein
LFYECEAKRDNESVGEFFGKICSESFLMCPVCGSSEIDETERCLICESEHIEVELFGGVCKECIGERKKDFAICYEIAKGEKQEIEINALLASLFSESEIEEILFEYVKANSRDFDCSSFIDEDPFWFGERLAEEVKK